MIPTTAGISEPDTSFGTSPLGVGVLILRNVERGWRSEQASTSTTPCTTFRRPRSSRRSFSGSSAAFWVALWRRTSSRDEIYSCQPPRNGTYTVLDIPHIADDGKRSALGLSVGATVLFLVFMFYWNRLLARLVFWLLRLKTWDADSNGSVWINAGMKPSASGNCVDSSS